MNGQNFRESFYTSNVVEGTDEDKNSPVENVDPFADRIPGDPELIQEIPTSELIVQEAPMSETTPNKAPEGETIADESAVPAAEWAAVPTPYVAPLGETIAHEARIGTDAGLSAALLNREESEHFRTRWNVIQGMFVDEPRSAVQQADALVSEVIGQITQMFTNEHSSLERQWNQGNDVSTEDLRKALQRYRSFFNRLVV